MSITPSILRSLAEQAARDGRASEAANLQSCANHVERIEAEVERLTKALDELRPASKADRVKRVIPTATVDITAVESP